MTFKTGTAGLESDLKFGGGKSLVQTCTTPRGCWHRTCPGLGGAWLQEAQGHVEIVEAETKTVSSHDESIRITEAATKGHCDMPNPELHPEKKSLTAMCV